MVLYCVVISTLFLVIGQNVLPACSQDNYNGNRAPPMDPNNVETLETHVETFQAHHNYSNYSTPATPPPEEVDCHVEVLRRVRIGGRCMLFGERRPIWLCQAGVHTQTSTECGPQEPDPYAYMWPSWSRRSRRSARKP